MLLGSNILEVVKSSPLYNSLNEASIQALASLCSLFFHNGVVCSRCVDDGLAGLTFRAHYRFYIWAVLNCIKTHALYFTAGCIPVLLS